MAFIVDLPIENGDFPVRYVSLLEGKMNWGCPNIDADTPMMPHVMGWYPAVGEKPTWLVV